MDSIRVEEAKKWLTTAWDCSQACSTVVPVKVIVENLKRIGGLFVGDLTKAEEELREEIRQVILELDWE